MSLFLTHLKSQWYHGDNQNTHKVSLTSRITMVAYPMGAAGVLIWVVLGTRSCIMEQEPIWGPDKSRKWPRSSHSCKCSFVEALVMLRLLLPIALAVASWEQFLLHISVMSCDMMLCPIVRIVQFSWSPINSELFLAFSVLQPMETRVHRLRLFWLDLAVDACICHCIICLYRRGWLLVAHFFKDDTNVNCFSCHDVKTC